MIVELDVEVRKRGETYLEVMMASPDFGVWESLDSGQSGPVKRQFR
jgi:hypothetical protein